MVRSVSSAGDTSTTRVGKASRFRGRLILHLLCWTLLLLLLSLRFVSLLADPPAGISTSGDLYTDEGWWAANASARVLTGHWYVQGGYNPAVVAPVMPLVEYAAFALFGYGLLTARIVSLLFFLLACGALYLLVAEWGGRRAAYLALLLAGASVLLFAFSRLAFLEMPLACFSLASLWLAMKVQVSVESRRLLPAAGAGLCLLLAILTKVTAICLLPVLLWLLVRRRGGIRPAAVFLAVLLLLGALYGGLASCRYPDDVRAFAANNLGNKLPHARAAVVSRADGMSSGVRLPINDRRLLATMFVILAVGAVALACPPYRRSRLLRVLLAWLACYLAIMLPGGYYPSRYFALLVFPASALVAVLLGPAWRTGWGRVIAIGVLLTITVPQWVLTARYLAAPRYSLLAAARDIRQRLPVGSRVLGDPAGTIGLLAGFPTMPESPGPYDLRTRLWRFPPSYYLRIGTIPTEGIPECHLPDPPRLLASFSVYGNYATGEPLCLYRFPGGSATEQQLEDGAAMYLRR